MQENEFNCMLTATQKVSSSATTAQMQPVTIKNFKQFLGWLQARSQTRAAFHCLCIVPNAVAGPIATANFQEPGRTMAHFSDPMNMQQPPWKAPDALHLL